jgi:hypothetical protein
MGVNVKWVIVAVLMVLAANSALTADKMLFWNETAHEMKGVYLAPAGTQAFGPNQALNDEDKSVSADERLLITGITPGRYDVKLVDTTERTCIVRNVEVRNTGKVAFSIAENDLTDCK